MTLYSMDVVSCTNIICMRLVYDTSHYAHPQSSLWEQNNEIESALCRRSAAKSANRRAIQTRLDPSALAILEKSRRAHGIPHGRWTSPIQFPTCHPQKNDCSTRTATVCNFVDWSTKQGWGLRPVV